MTWSKRIFQKPLRLWWSSLPARVIITTVAASSLVLALSGFLLMHQITEAVLETKRKTVIAESQTAFDIAQSTLSVLSNNQPQLDTRLTDVAVAAAQRGQISGQYDVILQAGAATFQPPELDGDPIPPELRQAIQDSDKIYVTASSLKYFDRRNGNNDVPTFVSGMLLEAAPGQKYPIYFIFPLEQEVATLELIQRAIITVGILLVLAMTGVAAAVSGTVVAPVRRAAEAAKRISEGDLEERLPIKGTDDLAVLGESMNDMAIALGTQISQYEELSRVQQRFVSDVSHELRTPLTTVRMAAELLYDSRDELSPVFARSSELLHDELDRFEALLADLLEISRFDAGAALLSLDRVSFAEVVQNEVEAQRVFAERMGTDIEVSVIGDTTADIDSRRIQRIMRNLITNAIEHGEKRPINITVSGEGNAVAVTVRDHGIGFEPSQSEHVFRRFWRADPSRARVVGGTGLGLAIAMEDAQLHRGWLESWGKLGHGAQFRLTLPKTQAVDLTTSPLSLIPSDEVG
ncbi:MAG: MtrAB system histidine kinase MtrB [Propionibacteriaceae bacterium]